LQPADGAVAGRADASGGDGVIVPFKGAQGTRYRAYYNKGKKRHYIGIFATSKAAKEAYEEYATTQRKVERGELPADIQIRQTFREASGAWIASLEKRESRSAKGTPISRQTLSTSITGVSDFTSRTTRPC